MRPEGISQQSVLIVSDVGTEGALVRSLLEGAFDEVLVANAPNATFEFFQKSRASVLVLAFRDLQKATRFYLGLYRRGAELHTPVHAHRTIALCDRKDVRDAYELCSSGQFNDYVQFWPTTYDAPRLLLAVRRALQDCSLQFSSSEASAALIAQGQRLAQLEEILSRYMKAGAGHVATAGLALAEAEKGIGTALDGLSTHLLNSASVQLRSGVKPDALSHELSRFGATSILPHLHGLSSTLEPLTVWVDKMKETVDPHIKTSRAQLDRALLDRPTILIVDDDLLQRQMAGRILESAGYSPRYAESGQDALNILRTMLPDLILMDVLMPGMSGLEVVQRLKAEPALAKIPVIMVSGKSVRDVVLESVKLGVSDFIVKPMEREMLLGKISRLLAPAASNAA
jgi:CheY-like chemotaxis protein